MSWEPPPLAAPRSEGIRGALGGSRLLDRPEHAAARERILAFLAEPGPVAFEIGFDHGMVILDHARRFPAIRWLGAEIRRKRVEAAAPHAPPNALLVREDARTLLHAVIPPARLSWVYILFPTPADNPRHLLLTPDTVADLARALALGGRVHLATDVDGMARWIERCFEGWARGDGVPFGPVLSRRERVARRDGLPVFRTTLVRPD